MIKMLRGKLKAFNNTVKVDLCSDQETFYHNPVRTSVRPSHLVIITQLRIKIVYGELVENLLYQQLAWFADQKFVQIAGSCVMQGRRETTLIGGGGGVHLIPRNFFFCLSLPEFCLSLPEFSRFLKILGGGVTPPSSDAPGVMPSVG